MQHLFTSLCILTCKRANFFHNTSSSYPLRAFTRCRFGHGAAMFIRKALIEVFWCFSGFYKRKGIKRSSPVLQKTTLKSLEMLMRGSCLTGTTTSSFYTCTTYKPKEMKNKTSPHYPYPTHSTCIPPHSNTRNSMRSDARTASVSESRPEPRAVFRSHGSGCQRSKSPRRLGRLACESVKT